MNISCVYEENYRFIYNFAMKLTCHPEDAQDLTQETFLKAMENLSTLKDEQALSGWLRTICYHEFLNRIKKNSKSDLVEPDELILLEQEGRLLVEVPCLFHFQSLGYK